MPKYVYIVYYAYDYEGWEIVSVHLNLPDARKAFKAWKQERPSVGDSRGIERHKVGTRESKTIVVEE
jgi:hypothetical protein